MGYGRCHGYTIPVQLMPNLLLKEGARRTETSAVHCRRAIIRIPSVLSPALREDVHRVAATAGCVAATLDEDLHDVIVARHVGELFR